ncbi:MAG: hypothetical protein H7Z43_02030 [Clostridia bacterium]|nr:hypothetical protein [Deltaproteobacteria bacterium]
MRRLAWLVVLSFAACGMEDDKGDEQLEEAFGSVGLHLTSSEVRSDGLTRIVATITQQVDHDDAASAGFEQRLVIFHRDFRLPVVMDTEGYSLGRVNGVTEPTFLLGSNEVQVEHRGFGRSTFDDLPKVTLAQAAADHHHVLETVGALYHGAWIAMGASKGGLAALAFRHFYPDDLAGVVAYVAPHQMGLRDPAYPVFVDRLGDSDCQTKLAAFQHDTLSSPRREELAESLRDALDAIGVHSNRLGPDRILEIAVRELRFTFWQYSSASRCASIPDVATADNKDVLDFIDTTSFFIYASDEGLEADKAYTWQSANELGYPADDADRLDDVVRYRDPETPVQFLSALELSAPVYDGTVLNAIADELAAGVPDVLLIYGELDPWTAGAFSLPGSGRFVEAGGNHYATITRLSDADRAAATGLLTGWVQ